MAGHRLTSQTIDSEAALIEFLGAPHPVTLGKLSARLTPLTRELIERAPFVCLATADREGNCDVSPRGDPAGFVRIVDDATLLLPERPGNRIADSLRNIMHNPHVGLLFIVPGVNDTFRVNGRATLTTDPMLLEPCSVEGKRPKLGILVDIDTAYTHCAKAFLRSAFWDATQFVDRASLPSPGALMRAVQGDSFDADKYDSERTERYKRREGFY